jgi:hypothetical protein
MAGSSTEIRTALNTGTSISRRPGEKRPPPLPPDGDVPPEFDSSSGSRTDSARKLFEKWSVCWLISAIINLLILLTTALLLLPYERSGGPLTLIASVDSEEGELESLSEAADTASLDFGVELEISQPEAFEPRELRVELDLAGGRLGQGPGGWRGGAGDGGAGGGTDYFGTVAYGDRFVYILDKSTSMNSNRGGAPEPDSRFARARYELLRSVDTLAAYQSFYVILFSTTTRRMFDDKSRNPVMIPATRENKRRLREWLEAADVGGGTDPREALFVAMSVAPDAIFFLSDGDFRVKRNLKQMPFDVRLDVEELVEQINRGYTPIHTIAYEVPSSKKRMEILAQLTGGNYKYIPPGEKAEPVPTRRGRR